MKKICYPVVFIPDETGGYTVFAPDINDGCGSQGSTLNEAIDMIQDAVGLSLEDVLYSGKPLPPASKPSDIDTKALARRWFDEEDLPTGSFTAPVEFDFDAYMRRYPRKTVKKTLSIPGWLNELAVERNINFSQTLQNALKQELGLQ